MRGWGPEEEALETPSFLSLFPQSLCDKGEVRCDLCMAMQPTRPSPGEQQLMVGAQQEPKLRLQP